VERTVAEPRPTGLDGGNGGDAGGGLATRHTEPDGRGGGLCHNLSTGIITALRASEARLMFQAKIMTHLLQSHGTLLPIHEDLRPRSFKRMLYQVILS